MTDRIRTHHVGTVTWQGTEDDFARWGIRLRRPVCIDCHRPHGDFHAQTCPYDGQVLVEQTIEPKRRNL